MFKNTIPAQIRAGAIVVVSILCLTLQANTAHAGGILCNWRAILANFKPSDTTETILIDGNRAFMTDAQNQNLLIYDISNPLNPSLISTFNNSTRYTDIALAGPLLYLAAGSDGMVVVDVSDPQNPVQIGAVDTPGYSVGIKLQSEIAYIADASGIHAIDIHDPKAPVIIGTFPTDGECFAIEISNQILYAVDSGFDINEDYGLHIIQASDPANMVELSSIVFPASLNDKTEIIVQNDHLYVTISDLGLLTYDVSNPALPSKLDSYLPQENAPIHQSWAAQDMIINGSTAYVNFGTQISVLDISNPSSVLLLNEIIAPEYINDIAVAGPDLFLVTSSGTVYIADPLHQGQSPFIGYFNNPGWWQYDVEVQGTLAFVGTRTGLQIIDISNPESPSFVGSYETNQYAYSVSVNGPYAYIASRTLGILIIDVDDPANPFLVGSISQFIDFREIEVVGNIAYTVASNGALVIVDASDPTTPRVDGILNQPGLNGDLHISGSTAYLANKSGGLRIIDVSDTSSPSLVGSYTTAHWTSAVTVEGTTAYLCDTDTGLNIVDISDPTKPSLMGTYDTGADGDVIQVQNGIVYIECTNYYMCILDATDPSNIKEIGRHRVAPGMNSLQVSGSTAYMTSGLGGLDIIDVSDCPPCPADLTGDTYLNFLDISAFLAAFGDQDPAADFNADGSFNFLDVSEFLSAFAAGCP